VAIELRTFYLVSIENWNIKLLQKKYIELKLS